MKYKIGIIGSGNIGSGLATHLAKTTNEVLLANRKGPESLTDIVSSIGGSLKASGLKETIEASDVLFFAVPWGQLKALGKQLEDYEGKIIIDTSNNIVSVSPFQLEDIGSISTGEYVAKLFPKHRVVKAFNTLAAATLKQPTKNELGRTVIVISGDDADAKKEVATITEAMGFAPVDTGTFAGGGKLQDIGGPFSGAELIKVGKR